MSRITYTRKSFLSHSSEVDEDLSLINFYYSSKIYNFNYKQQQRLGWKENRTVINTAKERKSEREYNKSCARSSDDVVRERFRLIKLSWSEISHSLLSRHRDQISTVAERELSTARRVTTTNCTIAAASSSAAALLRYEWIGKCEQFFYVYF